MSESQDTPSTLRKRIRVMRIIARMNIGGPAVQVVSLVRGFNALEFEQRLYCGYCSENESDYLYEVAPDIHSYRVNGLGRSLNLIGDIKAFLYLIREISRFKPDIVHTHTAKAGVLGRVAALLSNQSPIIIHTFHGHLLHGYFSPVKLRLIVYVEKFLAAFTDQLLAVGERVRGDLLRSGIGEPSKFGLMPPGLKLESLPPKRQSQELLGLELGTLQCSFIGRITQIKRPDRFLDVVSEMKRRGIQIEFFMAGDGELIEDCRKRVERENLPVKVLGWQTDIERVLSASDIVILTSDNEGTPLSLIQAGMAGKPVVSTNVGSVEDIVVSNVTGFITSLEVTEIADSLEKLATSPQLREQMGLAARNYTTDRFSEKRLVLDHQDLYKKLILDLANS